MPLRALVLDFDGLIVDTESSSYALVAEIYERHGAELSMDTWKRFVGADVDKFAYLQGIVSDHVDVAALHAEFRERQLQQTSRLAPCAGVRELVRDAADAGLRLGVASSSSHRWVDGHLDRVGLLSAFDAITCRDDVERAKPSPDVYLAVLVGLDVHAGEVVAFEDSPNGVLAARAAGLFTVAVPNSVTSSWTFEGADERLESLRDVSIARLRLWVTSDVAGR